MITMITMVPSPMYMTCLSSGRVFAVLGELPRGVERNIGRASATVWGAEGAEVIIDGEAVTP
jgi:hypothetical protein